MIVSSIIWSFISIAMFLPGYFFPHIFWSYPHIDIFSFSAIFLLGHIVLYYSTVSKQLSFLNKTPTVRQHLFLALFFLIIGLVLLYSFRLRIFLPPPQGRGDSLLLLRTIPIYSHVFGFHASYDELLELFFHSKFYLFMFENFDYTAIQSIALHNLLAYPLFIVSFFYFTRNKSYFIFTIALVFVFFTPRLSLFAGYIENYTFVSVYILTTIWYCAQLLKQSSKTNIAPNLYSTALIATLAAWSVLHHMIAAFMFPGLLIYIYLSHKKNLKNMILHSIVATVFAGTLIFITLYLFSLQEHQPSIQNAHIMHPPYLHPKQWFQESHLFDFYNALIVSIPLVLLTITFFFIHSRAHLKIISLGSDLSSLSSKGIYTLKNLFAPNTSCLFLFITSLVFLTEAFLHNPQIGFPADWDLFTFSSIPLGLWFLYRIEYTIKHNEISKKKLLPFLVMGLLLSFLTTYSWIVSNHTTSTRSQQNIKISNQILKLTLEQLKGSKTWSKIQTNDKKAVFLNYTMFNLNAKLVLQDKKNKRSLDLSKLLLREEIKFNEIILLPKEEYKTKLEKFYKRLGPINLEITRLKN